MAIRESLQPLSILVIDDCESDRALCRLALKRSSLGSVRVREAESGAQGIELARHECPDCILLDFMLPDLDGLEVLGALRNEDGEPLAPVVMLTGQGDETVAARAIQAGAQDYLVKGSLNRERLAQSIVGARARFSDRRRELAQREEFRAFASAAAHDLKAPLRRASAFADILAELCSAALSGEARNAALGITRSIRQMQMMVDSLLAFARCGSGLPSAKPIALEDVVQLALTNLSSTFDLERAAIKVGKLPTVPGDEGGLAILFQNLLSNGLKFNRSKQPKVTIDAELKGATWMIRVRDNGIGIASEHLDEVFVPLRRLHSDQDFEGTGLGLATCRRVAEHHHGRIECASELGRGSVFTIWLPMDDRTTSVAERGRSVRERPGAA